MPRASSRARSLRARQLRVRTLLAGTCLAIADGRPMHLTRVHHTLTSPPDHEQARLGVIADWKHGPHRLTCRQTEYTFGLAAAALGKDEPDGLPSQVLQAVCDDLLEASVPARFKDATASVAVDWTDLETFSRPPSAKGGPCADPEASWRHRKNNLLRSENELFFGYYFSAGIMRPEENGPPVAELARRMTLSSCRHDPVRAVAPVLTAMPAAGVGLGDVLADSGYAHRDAAAWAIPLRAAGAQLVQDLHPHDRGPKGTHQGAIIANGSLYCPCTPRSLLELGPPARNATPEKTAAHDAQTAEASRHKLGRITADDEDGYHRVQCPAAIGKIRCPLRPPSMTLDRDRPEILQPPEHPPACCTRRTITVPPEVNAKTAQKRLPVKGAPPLLRPPHRRRTRLRHHQRPRHQQHRPRLVPPDGPGPAHARRHLPAHRPQPAHPHRLGHPAGRQRAPRRGRAPAENKAPSTQDPHPDRRHHSAAPESVAGIHALNHSTATGHPAAHADRGSMPANHAGHARSDQANTQRTQHRPQPQRRQPSARMSDPNVNIGLTKT